MTDADRALLIRCFEAAIAAADPKAALAAHLPEKPRGRTVVIGAGKGAAQVAQAFEALWDGPLEGVIVTRYGYAAPCRQLKVLEAAHPVPDEAGLAATREVLAALEGLSEDDLVVALVTGGGSALLAAPPEGLELADEVALNEALLASGAPIGAMNAIRKQVSRVKGGRLAAAAAPARMVSLIVSDVPGDDPGEVASGPTVPTTVGRAAAMQAIRDYDIALPERIMAHLREAPEDAPDPADPRFARNSVTVIASAARSLEAAAEVAEAEGVPAAILSDAVEGEAREVAKVHAAIAREVQAKDRPFTKPVMILSGGETTVTLRGKGRGGRNSEFLLSLALEIEGVAGIAALAADTDGIDGSEDNAGAFADGDTVAAMRAAGLDPAALLHGNDAYSAFEAVGALFEPGPTGTNVNDFRAILLR
ncbi:glycerate kinase [Maritimibacter alkaliphilus]|uniref:glycerate kinase type-2 family protein n=1 Tax=Maritimibacter alkaliphilus TaxID=404236 RepID=UPI001C977B88|nr:glycerate kinase [Maritimibacter alkaliphilus]MBY6090296.1 glycerate kinase [Maritimibacter alkaliphilus]